LTVRALLLSVALLLSASAAEARPVPKDCWGKLKAPLEAGGFSPGVDCSGYYDLKIKYLGRTTGVRKYRVYHYKFILPAVMGGPGHGGDRILIFDDHMRYLGEYQCSSPVDRVWLRGSRIYFAFPKKDGNVLKLDGPEPPRTAWFLGDTVSFSK
jgi:hypothetical protein